MLPVWYVILAALLSILAVVGNGLVIYLITTRRRLHNATNWIILSLSVADVSVSGGTLLTEYLFDFFEDKLLRYSLVSFLSAVSATNLCLLTLDRYIFITRPLRYITLVTTKKTVVLITIIWLTSLLPHLAFYLTQKLLPSSTGKLEDMRAFIIVDFLIFEIFPMVFQVAATGHIFHIIRKSSLQTAIQLAQVNFNRKSEASREFLRRRHRNSSIKATVVAVTVFLAYALNKVIYNILCDITEARCAESYRYVIDILLLVDCSVNLVVYALLKSDIKNTFKSRLPCRRVSPYNFEQHYKR